MSWTVLGSPLSPFVRKVTVAMNLKQVSYDLDHTVSPFGLPDGFDKLNPLKRIPVVKHGDNVLADSGVICSYLDKVCPEPSLGLAVPYQQARVDWFEKFADYELAELLTFQAFQLLLLFPVMQREVNAEQVRTTLAEQLPPLLDYLDGEIGDSNYLVNNQLTIADIATVSQFICYHYSGETLGTGRWPNLVRYLTFHFQSSVFASIIEKELAIVAKMKTRAGIEA